jgi:hypothetical protein
MRGRHSSEVDKKVHREFVHWFSNRVSVSTCSSEIK